MNIRPFEIALVGFFAFTAIAGLIFLSVYQSKPSADATLFGDRVIIWGMLDQKVMNDFLFSASETNKALQVVSYKQIDPRNFEDTFVNAVAEGKSPDLIIIPQSLLVSMRTKLMPISFETLSQRTFKDSYVDGADIFMRNDAIYGIPFAVDPLVMYWNRDIFASSGVAQPPKTWELLVSETTPALVHVSDTQEVQQAALAFGEYRNVSHAKEILSMLFMQADNTIVEESGDGYRVTFANTENSSVSSAEAVLNFYTQFALPSKNLYTWNRSKPLDRNEFTAGKLGMYFGLGSEIKNIERENPNLSYDIAMVPQGTGATTLRTYGEFQAFAIPRASQRAQGAYAVALALSSPQYIQTLTDALGLVPAQRALYSQNSKNPSQNILFQSGLIARGWLDPSPQGSANAFSDMVEEVTSGGTRQKGIILDTAHRLETLF